ncbi:MAG: DUF1304 domain-containing protein [Bdellovibrionota bacterium]
MKVIFFVFAVVTALLHCLFFKLESIDFMNPEVLKKFGLNAEQGSIVKVWAFNQGFYNLFLGIGLFYSIYLIHSGDIKTGLLLSRFALLTIIGAGTVLLISSPEKYIAALMQLVPAVIGLGLSFFL